MEAALDRAGAASVFSDWTLRKRGDALLRDLEEMGGDVTRNFGDARIRHLDSEINYEAAIAGALYVVEGSRLGGKVLSRQLGDDFPARYLNPDQPPGHWRTLLIRLDGLLDDPGKLQIAVESAQSVFLAFEQAGRNWLLKE